jgi:hypothetical protein
MSRRTWLIGVLVLGAILTGYKSGWGAHERSDFDRMLAVGPGGSLSADIELGGGISFDHGSLEVRSHDDAEVRIVSETSGWGKYAVGLDVEQEGNKIQLVGRVAGSLHWMFGGPSLDVRVWVPRDFNVQARIEGGPLVLEDLAGPLRAEVHDAEATLRRSQGPVTLRLEQGSVQIEDIDGPLDVQLEGGDMYLVGMRGELTVRATHGGHMEVDSVIGPVRIESEHHRVDIEDIQGDLEVRTEYARVDAEDIEGRVVAQTGHGGLHLENIDGEVIATSVHGMVQIEFAGVPRGRVETESGRIEIQVPDEVGFDLDARSERGRIRLDDFDEDRDWGDHGSPRRDDDEDGKTRRERRRERKQREAADWPENHNRGNTPARIVREINGGGPTLEVRTANGSIRIRD